MYKSEECSEQAEIEVIESVKGAARYLGVTPASIRGRIKRGTLAEGPWEIRELEASEGRVGVSSPRGLRGPHGTVSGWTSGCTCKPCTGAHNAETRNRNRRISTEVLEPVVSELLDLLRGGTPLPKAAKQLGVQYQRVYGVARHDVLLSRLIDEAAMAGRDPSLSHGTESAYRDGCRCPECREAKRRTR